MVPSSAAEGPSSDHSLERTCRCSLTARTSSPSAHLVTQLLHYLVAHSSFPRGCPSCDAYEERLTPVCAAATAEFHKLVGEQHKVSSWVMFGLLLANASERLKGTLLGYTNGAGELS